MANKTRKTVKIDEQQLREMMAGDIPHFKYQDTATDYSSSKDNGIEKVLENEPADRLETEAYEESFLTRQPSLNRKHTYVSSEYYDEILAVLPTIAPGLSFPNFLDNVLREHIESHKKTIQDLYNAKNNSKHKNYGIFR